MEDMKFCQSCGMPLTKTEDFGTEKDGKLSEDYCAVSYTHLTLPTKRIV